MVRTYEKSAKELFVRLRDRTERDRITKRRVLATIAIMEAFGKTIGPILAGYLALRLTGRI